MQPVKVINLFTIVLPILKVSLTPWLNGVHEKFIRNGNRSITDLYFLCEFRKSILHRQTVTLILLQQYNVYFY